MGIRLLARELNLSIGTVSRALNNRPDVNDATRERVKEAAQRTGYVANQSGRSLRKGRTGIVATLIPATGLLSSSDTGLVKVLEGARRTLRGAEVDLVILFRGPEECPLENLRRAVARHIADAFIITHTTAADPRLPYLKQAGVEHVAFGRAPGIDDYPWVDFDFEAVAAEAVAAFIYHGHRRLALLLGEHDMNYEDILTDVFRAEARKHGAESIQVLHTSDAHLTSTGRAIFAAPGAPTAVLASHENIACALYSDLAALNLRIGTEVSMICVFPPAAGSGLSAEIAHFDADLDAVGAALARHLIALLPDQRAAPGNPLPTRIPLRFTPRASLAPAQIKA